MQGKSTSAAAFRTVIVLVSGALMLAFCAMLVPPLAMSFFYHDALLSMWLKQLAIAIPVGSLMLLYGILQPTRLQLKDGFIIVALLWLSLSLLGSLPFYFSLPISYSDALFESASGITTTGATVLTSLDLLPRSLLFYRQEIQWIGGIGVIVSAIALLPVLGIGGMQLMKAETPGPVKGDKLTPRLAETARALWGIYLFLTVSCASLYWIAGMDLFDAVGHAFTTVSTGGFSTHDASLGYFDSTAIETIAVVFMLLGAINFGVHFAAFTRGRPTVYFHSDEVRSFIVFTVSIVVVVGLTLAWTDDYDPAPGAFRSALFTVVSVITSTGFAIDDFSAWPLMLPVLMIFISFVGGCAGSTAGGMKVLRFIVMVRQAKVEIMRLIHPNIVKPVLVDGKSVSDNIVRGVWAFFAAYVVVFATLMMILMADGLDQVSAFGAVATCLNNLGPGLGDVASNFQSISGFEKYTLAVAMIIGRLEIFTVLVLLTPEFWRA